MVLELVSHSRLTECRRRIRDDFVADCLTRARVGRLPAGTFAGGQFFSQPEQRGLLGTAAALRVLSLESRSDQRSREVASGIVHYLADRERIELDASRTPTSERSLWRRKVPRDHRNTIRQSELLLSLTFVPSAVAACDGLKTEVATRLLGGRSQDGDGWGYELSNGRGSLLPTCHAVRALARNGNDVTSELLALGSGLQERISRRESDIRTAYVDCFTVLILDELDALASRTERAAIDHLWQLLVHHMDVSREANIDVLGGPANDFVRVPWQSHLMSLAVRIRPWRRFLAPQVQRRLGDMADGILGQPGFRYPDSGDSVSTRTYAYLYETISTILEARGGVASVDSAVAQVLRAAERPRRSVVRLVRILAGVGAVTTILWSILMWRLGRTGSWTDLAPNFVAGLVLACLGWLLRPKP